MPQKFTRIQRLFLNCSGVDIPTMEECNSAEAKKYRIIGITVLIPTVLAFFTGGYAMYKISDNLYYSGFFACIWCWIIFTIDRAIVANTTSNEITWGFLGRIILAVFISVLISQPIEILIFSDIIENERRQEIDSQQKKETSPIDVLIARKEAEVVRIDSTIEQRRLERRIEVTKGDPNSGRPPGVGRIAQELEEYEATAIREGEAKKLVIRSDIDSLKNERNKILANVADTYPDGLIGDIEVLHLMGGKNRIIKIAIWFLFLFFLILEVIPIIVKMGSMKGGKDLYHTVKEANEAICLSAKSAIESQQLEMFKNEQLFLLSQRKQKIESAIQNKSIKEASDEYSFYINVSKEATFEFEKTKSELVNKIKEEAVREDLLVRILKIYKEYSSILGQMIQDNLNRKKEN